MRQKKNLEPQSILQLKASLVGRWSFHQTKQTIEFVFVSNCKQLEIPLSEVTFWTDSTTVLQ